MIVQDYDLGDCPGLERNFMVWDPVTHSQQVLGMYYSSNTRTLYIPRGLDIWKVKQYLGLNHHEIIAPSKYESTGVIKMKNKPRDDEQEETLKFMIGLDQYEDNFYQPQLSVNLSTGKGKTYCSIGTICFLRIKSIIITDSNTLLTQWKNNIKEYTELGEEDILFISGSPMMNMIYNDKSQKAKKAKIFLCTHSTIRSYCDTYGWNRLNEILEKLGIGMKFIDEAHKHFNNMLMLDFFTNIFKTFYVTATPQRSSREENKVYQLSMKNVPFIDLFDSNKDPHTDYIAIKYNSHPSPLDISRCKNAYGLDRNKYVDYITKNDNFYRIMRVVMDYFLRCGGRGLFYIGTNEGIIRVYKWICNNYPQLVGDVGIYTSIMSKEQKLLERNKKLILSTTKSAGAGEDIAHLKMTANIAEPFRSEVLARQTLGRTRDKDTFYIDLVDLGFSYIRSYYFSKLKVFNKYASSTTDTVIDDYELSKRSERLEEKQNDIIEHSPFVFYDNIGNIEGG